MSTIDTKSIVSQLMAIERRPQDMLRSRLSTLKSAQTAWGQISDKLTALKTAAESLAPTGAVDKLIAVSSDDPTAVAVSATGTLQRATSASIEVTRLASAHTVVMDDVFSGSTAADGGRSLDVTIGGTTHTVTSDDGTIGGLAREINAAGIGVTARVLQTTTGNYQLTLTSTATGAASAFTVAGSGWTGGSTVARTGTDAELTVDGVAITRASNTVSDVIDGVELTLKTTTASPVTVSAERDDDTLVSRIKNLVDAANNALSTVSNLTKASATAAERGVLSTDSVAKALGDKIRSFVANGLVTADGTRVSASVVGVSLTRDGKLSFDEAGLRQHLADDPDAVLAALGRSGASTLAGVSVSSVAGTAVEGQRVVSVTRAAAQASMIGVPLPPPPAGTTVSMTVVTPSGTQTIEFEAGASFTETAANFSVALRGVGVRATVTGVDDGGGTGHYEVVTDGYGSNQLLDFSGAGADALGVTGSATGVDAEVDIDGTTYTATGRSLLKDGVAYSITYTQAQLDALGGTASGDVRIMGGFAGGLSALGAEGSSTGTTARAKDTLSDRIDDVQDRIDEWDTRLSQRQLALERRFTAMEQMLTKLNAMSAQLGYASVSSLPTG